MTEPPPAAPVPLDVDPVDAIAAWPNGLPILSLMTGDAPGRHSRWSLLATPTQWISLPCSPMPTRAALEERLESLERPVGPPPDSHLDAAPFPAAGWIGFMSYELGALLEPAARNHASARAQGDWPLLQFAAYDGALLFDHAAGRWSALGAVDPRLVAHLANSASKYPLVHSFTASDRLTSILSPDEYVAAVARTIEYIKAGDIFQANITRRLSLEFTGSTRELARRAFTGAHPRYGAYLELPDNRAIISMSPELLLHADPRTKRALTRPIKGTAPASAHPEHLMRSAKDAAELHMIVDLMRNDLGRICTPGSVSVPTPRIIEPHCAVHHGVGEVTGTLRGDVRLVDLLRAVFPAGSITGAPKIRAMQIIDELESVPRGAYCGAIGVINGPHDVRLNVGIRTIQMTGTPTDSMAHQLDGSLHYGVGAGIVVDSDPIAELRETDVKADAFLRAVWPGDVAAASVLRRESTSRSIRHGTDANAVR